MARSPVGCDARATSSGPRKKRASGVTASRNRQHDRQALACGRDRGARAPSISKDFEKSGATALVPHRSCARPSCCAIAWRGGCRQRHSPVLMVTHGASSRVASGSGQKVLISGSGQCCGANGEGGSSRSRSKKTGFATRDDSSRASPRRQPRSRARVGTARASSASDPPTEPTPSPLRPLYEEEHRGRPRAGVQHPRCAARSLRGVCEEPGRRRLESGPEPLRRWRLLRCIHGAPCAQAASLRHRSRQGRRGRRLQDRPPDPVLARLRHA